MVFGKKKKIEKAPEFKEEDYEDDLSEEEEGENEDFEEEEPQQPQQPKKKKVTINDILISHETRIKDLEFLAYRTR